MKNFLFSFSLLVIMLGTRAQGTVRYHYALRVYHLADTVQQGIMDRYLQTALVPALHRAGVQQVGVFKPVARQLDSTVVPQRTIYLLIPLKTDATTEKIDGVIATDAAYQAAAKDFTAASFDHPSYVRMETILLRAFSGHPQPAKPKLRNAAANRIYELRSYQGATEAISLNKIRMFNDGNEVRLFERLGFNAVFYGQVIAGSEMPNLMYMTSFEDREDRDRHWQSFGNDTEWKRISALPEYQHNVSHIDTWLLAPTVYSDL